MTEAELAKIEKLWKDGVRLEDIAEDVGYSLSYVRSIVCKNRDRFPYRHRTLKRTRKRDMWLARIRADRTTKEKAAEALGVGVSTIIRWLREGVGE